MLPWAFAVSIMDMEILFHSIARFFQFLSSSESNFRFLKKQLSWKIQIKQGASGN
jgi:hypothetical protein